jgi:Kef-type K+ transport system membrane component KefB
MQSSVHETEQLLSAVLIQIGVIILAARGAGAAAVALRQPRAVGEIAAGLLLGPSFFGFFLPEASALLFPAAAAQPVMILSQIGLLLLMFQIGSDFEFGHLGDRSTRKATLNVAAASIAAPFAAGLALGWLSAPILAPDVNRVAYSLFIGVALAITAVPILGRILREYGLTRHKIGVIAISAAAGNDVIGWVMLAGIAAFASAAFSPGAAAAQIAALAGIALVLKVAVTPAVGLLLQRFPVRDGAVPGPLMAIVIAGIFAFGVATQAIGVFTIFGGFLFGLVFHPRTEFVEAWRRQVGQFVLVFFLPIFFTYTGLRTNLLGLSGAADWAWLLTFLVAAVLSKIAPVYAAARASGLSPAESSVLASLMNTRALMELIVLNIGYSLGVIPQDVFTMLVFMAIATTIMTGPLLQYFLPRAGLPAERLQEG